MAFVPGYGPSVDDQGRQKVNTSWGNRSGEFQNGAYVPGSSGAERDVARYQSMGAQAAGRAAPQSQFQGANYGMADQARGEQASALQMQRQAAMGNAPSRAELLQGKVTDDAINSQMALAASARGGPGAQALAARMAGTNAATMQQAGARDLSALRADEMARARGEYMQGATGIRGQDVQQSQYDASAANQSNQFNAQAQLASRGQNDAQQMGYEKLGFGVNQADMAGRDAQAARDQHAGEFGAAQDTHKDDRLWDLGTKVVGGIFGGAGGLLSDKNAKEDARKLGQAEGMMAGIQQSAAAPLATQGALDRSRAMDMTGAPGGIVRDNPYMSAQTPDRNAPMGSSGDIIRDNPYGADPKKGTELMSPAGGAILGGIGQGLSGSDKNYGVEALKQDPRYAAGVGSRLKYLDENGLGYEELLSDERQKQDARTAEPARMMDALTPYAYHYKPESGQDPSKQRYGIMAQDLERTPMGASVVNDTPQGKQIDVPQAVGVSLASLANVNQRVRALEGNRARNGKR